MSNITKRGVAIFCLVVVLLLSVAVIANAAIQTTWYLSKDSASGLSGSGTDYYKMVTSAPGGNPAISINKGDSAVWIDEASLGSVATMPPGNWTGELYNNTNTDKYNVEISIGTCTTGGVFSSQGHIDVQLPDKTTYNFTITSVPSFTIYSGEYLAFQIKNIDDRTGSIVIKHGTVTDPKVKVSPPVPELPAFVLLAGGLLGIGAFVIVRKHQMAAAGK